MSTISLPGQTKVSTLQERFKNDFGLTLRVYDGRSFAEPDATIGQVRKKRGATSIDIRRNTKVGNIEDRFMEDFGIKVQIAGSDNSYLCDNDLTLAAALAEDEGKLGRKATRAAAGEDQDSNDDQAKQIYSVNSDFQTRDNEEREMQVSVDVYTKDLDAGLAAFKFALENGAIDVRINSNHDYDTKEFENLNLMFEADHSSEAISQLDRGPFAKDTDDL